MNDLISREAAVELLREKAREYTVSKFATNSCSLCGCSAFDLHGANYCPNCGARMDEEVSGNDRL